MKKAILSILLALCMMCTLLPVTAGADATAGVAQISDFAGLQSAFADGGTYKLANDITVTEGLTLVSGKNLTIDGDGHTIQPAVTGINEQGLVNADATAIANIITNNGTLTLRGLTIYGGKGRCINNTGTLTMNNVSLERAHLTNGNKGAGICNSGNAATAILTDCNIRRNGCDSASGGFRNDKGTLIMENCAIVENRNFGSSAGGGGGENQGTLYMNNCTVANNQSSEIGGGLNNYKPNSYAAAVAYIMNSTFTGNVSTANYAKYGGGIGNNGGTVYAVNSVFAFNYAKGQASDIGCYSGGTGKIFLYHCAYGQIIDGSSSVSYATTDNNCKALETTDTPATVFNGVRSSGVVDKDGTESTSNLFARPVITPVDGTYGVYPAASSTLKSGAVKTYYQRVHDGNSITVKMGYESSDSSILPLDSLAAPAAGYAVIRKYSNSQTTNNVIGAWPAPISNISTTMYTVTVKPATGGTVTGGSAQGNSYPAGTTNIQITATPNTGYAFSGWLVGDETTTSVTTTTYTINSLTGDVTLTPVFVPGEATPTYGITLAPTALTFTATKGYTAAPEAQEVTVTNSGNTDTGALNVTLSGGDTSAFTLSASEFTNIAAGGNAKFTVTPKTGLAAGTYTETVTVSNGGSIGFIPDTADGVSAQNITNINNDISATLTVTFTVSAAEVTPPAPPAPSAPSAPSAPVQDGINRQNANTTTTTDSTAVTSPKTGDMGIAVYAALSIMSVTGSAWIVGTKRRH